MKTLEERTKEYIAFLKENNMKVTGCKIYKNEDGRAMADIYTDNLAISGRCVIDECVVSAFDGKIELTLFDE